MCKLNMLNMQKMRRSTFATLVWENFITTNWQGVSRYSHPIHIHTLKELPTNSYRICPSTLACFLGSTFPFFSQVKTLGVMLKQPLPSPPPKKRVKQLASGLAGFLKGRLDNPFDLEE